MVCKGNKSLVKSRDLGVGRGLGELWAGAGGGRPLSSKPVHILRYTPPPPGGGGGFVDKGDMLITHTISTGC